MNLAVPSRKDDALLSPADQLKVKLRRQLREAQRSCATAANVITRAFWLADAAAMEQFRIENGAVPKGKDWPIPKINVYALGRAHCPALNTGIVAAIGRAAQTKWLQIRWKALVQQICSPPHYRDTGAFPLRAQEVNFATDGEDYSIRFSLLAGRDGRISVPLVPRDEYQRTLLSNLVDGTWKYGNVMVENDRLKPWKWYFRVAYSRRVPARQEGHAAAVNRGIRCFLTAVTSTGESWLYDGQDIVAFLKQIQRRRREYQYASKASNRGGHGRKRIIRPIEHLQGKAERWRQSKCQTIAVRLADWLAARDIRIVYIEDLSGIRDSAVIQQKGALSEMVQEWPYYQLQQRLTSCLQERGIKIETVEPSYISQTCPKCGFVSEENKDLTNWRLKCTAPKCGYKRHLDIAAATNVLGCGTSGKELKAPAKRKPKGLPT